VDNYSQSLASKWFRALQLNICQEFEKIEEEYLLNHQKFSNQIFVDSNSPIKFQFKKWQRSQENKESNSLKMEEDFGGGEMSIMKGNVFEKVGVNFSEVYGEFSPEFCKQIPGTANSPRFWASGISLVAHFRSPLVPAVHFNTRMIKTEKSWFGGGSDLNPIFPNQQDTEDFHNAFKKACDITDLNYYPQFKKQCDEYFFIKHRNVARGVGGIFFDYLNNNNFEADFNFVQNVGRAFLEIFPVIVRRSFHKNWNAEQRAEQLRKRALYAEFNLIYDRGTKFGLMTNGNIEAILMSMPPIACWE